MVNEAADLEALLKDVDFSWEWSEQDLEDITLASLHYFDEQEAKECQQDKSVVE